MPKHADKITAEGFEVFTPRSEGPQRRVTESHCYTMTVRPSGNPEKEVTFLIRGKVDRDQLAQMLKTGEGLDGLEFFATGNKPGSKVYRLESGKDTVLAFAKDTVPIIEEVHVRKKARPPSIRSRQEQALATQQVPQFPAGVKGEEFTVAKGSMYARASEQEELRGFKGGMSQQGEHRSEELNPLDPKKGRKKPGV